ncbi:hypothetical protein WMY93_032273 [Mugilogobius chulae]|uniref:Coiled-coil domain containing 33 n=1 Tax=Mugilogobius chulae TaxID=88201 RepID=A0AAW0MJR9_9GOBI
MAEAKVSGCVQFESARLKNTSYSLPSHDALAQILPHSPQSDCEQEPASHSDPQDDSSSRFKMWAIVPVGPPTSHLHHDCPGPEVQRYRDAMGRMAADMISLRRQMVALQTENSRLRALLSEFEDPGLELLRDTDLDVMTKAEMADRIASLTFRLSSELNQTSAQSNRILQLQNQLIRKNDSEKELLKLQVSLQRQPGFGPEQRRMRELEATVRHQGKVIESLERARQSYNVSVKHKPKGRVSLEQRQRKDTTPAAGNTGLRQELLQPPTHQTQPRAQRKESASARERLSLLAELERTETRRHILEQQLEENSKLWGKQKQQMLIQLSEQKHGFNQTVPQ